MKTQTRLSFLAIAAVACSAVSADPLYSFEGGSLHFVGDLGIVYEDNVFRASTDKEADTRLEFAPGLELKLSQGAATSTTVRYLHRFTLYEDLNELDSDFSEFDFDTSYDSGATVAKLYVRYKEDYTSTFDLDDTSDVFGALILRDVMSMGGSLKKDLSELTAVKAALDYKNVDYNDNFYTGYESFTVPVTYFYQIRPKVDLTAGARYRFTDTDTPTEYHDWYAYVGAVGELFSPVVYADFTVGYQKRNAKFSNADAESPAYKLTLYYLGDAKATHYATISRDYRTSSIQAQAYAATVLQLGSRYSLTEALSVNGALLFGENDYEESVRKEDILMFIAGATYSPNDYISLKATYSYRDIDGANEFSSSYTANEIRVMASLRY